MLKRIKIFSNSNYKDLENQVNEFMKQRQIINVEFAIGFNKYCVLVYFIVNGDQN